MNKLPDFHAGQELTAEYPFVRDVYADCDEGGPFERKTWKPGVNHEMVYPDDSEAFADAKGQVVYTVIALFKPGSFPERVFYIRNWIDPDGKRFGKNKLRVTTKQNFRNLIRGYRYGYELYEESK